MIRLDQLAESSNPLKQGDTPERLRLPEGDCYPHTPRAALQLTAAKHYAYGERRPRSELRPVMISVLIMLHLGALAPVIYYIATWQLPSADVVALAVGLGMVSGFGITLGYHRYFTHNGFKTSRSMQAVMLLAAGLALEGPASDWVPTHWYHHKRSDLPGDLHSPFQYRGIRGKTVSVEYIPKAEADKVATNPAYQPRTVVKKGGDGSRNNLAIAFFGLGRAITPSTTCSSGLPTTGGAGGTLTPPSGC